MKTSNIILSALIGSISLFIIVGAIDVRLSELKTSHEQAFDEIPLSPFRHLVIRRSVNLTIRPSEESKIMVHRGQAEIMYEGIYWLEGDTLFIDGSRPEPDAQILSILIQIPPGNLKSIMAENAAFSMSEFPTPQLTVSLANSRLRIYGASSGRIGSLHIKGTNDSDVTALDSSIDTLQLHLDKSNARIQSYVGVLSGAMTDHSSLYAREVSDFQFKKDSTSRLQ